MIFLAMGLLKNAAALLYSKLYEVLLIWPVAVLPVYIFPINSCDCVYHQPTEDNLACDEMNCSPQKLHILKYMCSSVGCPQIIYFFCNRLRQ